MQPSAEKIWGVAQQQLRSMLSADTFNLWFAPLRAVSLDQNTLVLDVANDFCEVWLKDNYMGLLQDVLGVASGQKLSIQFKVANGTITAVPPALPTIAKVKTSAAHSEKASAANEPGFNPKNTFDTFVVGNNNNFA